MNSYVHFNSLQQAAEIVDYFGIDMSNVVFEYPKLSAEERRYVEYENNKGWNIYRNEYDSGNDSVNNPKKVAKVAKLDNKMLTFTEDLILGETESITMSLLEFCKSHKLPYVIFKVFFIEGGYTDNEGERLRRSQQDYKMRPMYCSFSEYNNVLFKECAGNDCARKETLINDIVCGFFILFENYYLVGDYIEAGKAEDKTVEGTVEAIELRTTRIRHPNGQLQIIRNGDIGSITNYSKQYIFAVVEVYVPYNSNLTHIYQVIEEI
jgi:hypothetical protein